MKQWYFLKFGRNRSESLGQKGERVALEYLQTLGMKFLAKNVRNRFGEIDLILQDDQTVVFVEVRTRSRLDYGEPIETVAFVKQSKLSRAATVFLKSEKMFNRSARFDVVTIVWNSAEGKQELKHFVNAFEMIE